MRNALILVLVLLLVWSCDPPYGLLVENSTGEVVRCTVQTRDVIHFDSLHSSNQLIPEPDTRINRLSGYLTQHLPIVQVDSHTYTFELAEGREVLVGPATIGLPIREVSCQCKGHTYHLLGDKSGSPTTWELHRKGMILTVIHLKP